MLLYCKPIEYNIYIVFILCIINMLINMLLYCKPIEYNIYVYIYIYIYIYSEKILKSEKGKHSM